VYNITSYVVPVSGETVLRYNSISRYVKVRVGKIFVVQDDYPTMQEAIDQATPGYTIYVVPGTYHEFVTVNKPLKLEGENRSTTIIDGLGSNYNLGLIYVDSENVEITGFTIRNTTEPAPAIRIICSRVNVTGNTLMNAYSGVELYWGSSNNYVANNTVMNNSVGILEYFYAHNNSILSNQILRMIGA